MGSVRRYQPVRVACPQNDAVVQNAVGIASILSQPSMVAIPKGRGAWNTWRGELHLWGRLNLDIYTLAAPGAHGLPPNGICCMNVQAGAG